MQSTPLQAFIGKVLASRRLLYGDLQRLQRDVLPNGIANRAEAKALIALGGVLGRVDEGWSGYLTTAIKAFVLSTSQPPGTIDSGTAAWLVSALVNLPPKMAITVACEVALEARHVDDALLSFIGKTAKGRAKTRPAAPLRQVTDPRVSALPVQAYSWGAISAFPQAHGQ